MRTPATRTQLARDHCPYATCLTDAEWSLVALVLPLPSRRGRPRLWPLRLVVDAILYVLRSGTAWRHLPREFPPWATVHRWFLRLAQAGTFERLCHRLAMADRERAGREASPMAAIVDAQAARSGGVGVAGQRGFGWISRWRRLNRDHEATPSSATAFFTLAAAMALVTRLARQS